MHKIVAKTLAVALGAVSLSLAACNDSSSPVTSTAPSSTTERIKHDFSAAGHDLKNAGDDMARKADPAIERAKQDAKDTLHTAAQKIAEATSSTQPATVTAPTQP